MYPCIFPNGDDGWHYELDRSCLQHTNYHLMDQDGIVNPILCGQSLGQQFVVHCGSVCKIRTFQVTLHKMQSERNAC